MNDIMTLAAQLHLPYIKNNYNEAINEARDKQFSYEDFLALILNK